MRSRNLKPGFFKNELLIEIEPLGRMLFAGLWCLADREGRLEDRPQKIKFEILPGDQCDIEVLLNALQIKGFILRYAVNESKYIQILNFLKHQTPHTLESNSKIPAPVLYQSKTSKNLYKNKINREKNNSIYRNQESGISIKEGGVGETTDFDRFWNLYPTRDGKRVGKKECFEFFKKNLSETDISSLLIATEHYAQSKTVRDGYSKHPIRFLRKDFWKDWIEPPEQEVPSYLRGCKDFLDHAEQESTEEDRKDQ